MKSLESAREHVDQKIQELLDEGPSSDYNQRQIQLAVEKFVVEHPEATLDHDMLEQITLDWATSDMGKGFGKIAQDPQFKTHPRFQGDVSHIAVEDVAHCSETGKIPE